MFDKIQLAVELGELCHRPFHLLIGFLGEEVGEVVHLVAVVVVVERLEEEEEVVEQMVLRWKDLQLR